MIASCYASKISILIVSLISPDSNSLVYVSADASRTGLAKIGLSPVVAPVYSIHSRSEQTRYGRYLDNCLGVQIVAT